MAKDPSTSESLSPDVRYNLAKKPSPVSGEFASVAAVTVKLPFTFGSAFTFRVTEPVNAVTSLASANGSLALNTRQYLTVPNGTDDPSTVNVIDDPSLTVAPNPGSMNR